jgi:hypothetical protein
MANKHLLNSRKLKVEYFYDLKSIFNSLHSPSSSDEFKNAWSYTCIHPYVFMVLCSVKHKEKFALP